MKKNKLSIEKFTISKLNNLSQILGGYWDGDNDGGETGKGGKCVQFSRIILKDKIIKL